MEPLCLVIGPLPPPRHGVSAINETLVELARGHGLRVQPINTAPVATGSSLRVRVSRWGRIVHAIGDIFSATSTAAPVVAYFSVSGGWGVVYEIVMVALTRSRGARIVLHHHSFRYLNSPFRPMRWLVRTAGQSAWHVVLCQGMKEALQAGYGVKQALVLTNASFHPESLPLARSRGLGLRVGHLSNLCAEKGLFDVLELAEQAQTTQPDLRFEIAGPFVDTATESQYRQRAAKLTNLTYLGPLYGAEKQRFFQRIDVFTFPTRYRNEAEPLVILEAMSEGCPVIAYDRGCIGALVDEHCGRLVAQAEPFAEVAGQQLRTWQSDAAAFNRAATAAAEKFTSLRHAGIAARGQLLSLLQAKPLP